MYKIEKQFFSLALHCYAMVSCQQKGFNWFSRLQIRSLAAVLSNRETYAWSVLCYVWNMITQTVHIVHAASYILIGSRAKEGSAVLHSAKQCLKYIKVCSVWHRDTSKRNPVFVLVLQDSGYPTTLLIVNWSSCTDKTWIQQCLLISVGKQVLHLWVSSSRRSS